jgi:hypothetical protein
LALALILTLTSAGIPCQMDWGDWELKSGGGFGTGCAGWSTRDWLCSTDGKGLNAGPAPERQPEADIEFPPPCTLHMPDHATALQAEPVLRVTGGAVSVGDKVRVVGWWVGVFVRVGPGPRGKMADSEIASSCQLAGGAP